MMTLADFNERMKPIMAGIAQRQVRELVAYFESPEVQAHMAQRKAEYAAWLASLRGKPIRRNLMAGKVYKLTADRAAPETVAS